MTTVKRKNKVKPTRLQRKAFENMRNSSIDADEAMIKAGYSSNTALSPKQNLMDTPGFKLLIEEYRDALRKQGLSTDFMAKVQMSGLHDKDAKVRLEYLKESKKDLGIFQPDNKPNNILIGIGLSKKDYEY